MRINKVKWITGSSVSYNALDTKDINTLYFLTDTNEIYKGEISYTQSVVFYTSILPTEPALGKMYVNTVDLMGSVWTGAEWKTITAPVENVVDIANLTKGVTGKAVVDYIAEQNVVLGKEYLSSVTYDEITKTVSFVKNGITSNLPLTKLGTSIAYDGATGKLSILDSASSILSEVNIPLDNFVKSGSYNNVTEALVLVLQDDTTISIPAEDLVALYEAEDTNSVGLSITNGVTGNIITANVRISATAGNELQVNADGLYVATDISGKLDKVSSGKAGEIIISDTDGNVITSGIQAGGVTLSETPDIITLATEKAVMTKIEELLSWQEL